VAGSDFRAGAKRAECGGVLPGSGTCWIPIYLLEETTAGSRQGISRTLVGAITGNGHSINPQKRAKSNPQLVTHLFARLSVEYLRAARFVALAVSGRLLSSREGHLCEEELHGYIAFAPTILSLCERLVTSIDRSR
jgi:hypothetical protein